VRYLKAAVLANDLKFSTVFDVMEAAILPFDPGTVQLDQERAVMPGLAALKVQQFAVGQVSSRGREAVLEGRLFDVNTGNQVFAKRYVGDAKFFRLIIHRFADDIMFKPVGEQQFENSYSFSRRAATNSLLKKMSVKTTAKTGTPIKEFEKRLELLKN